MKLKFFNITAKLYFALRSPPPPPIPPPVPPRILATKRKTKTRGPWWSYIAHLSKQLCILTVEVSAKFTALRFLYKFYSPVLKRLCFFFSCIMMASTESWKRITKGTILPRYIEIGPVVSDKKNFKMFYIAI